MPVTLRSDNHRLVSSCLSIHLRLFSPLQGTPQSVHRPSSLAMKTPSPQLLNLLSITLSYSHIYVIHILSSISASLLFSSLIPSPTSRLQGFFFIFPDATVFQSPPPPPPPAAVSRFPLQPAVRSIGD